MNGVPVIPVLKVTNVTYDTSGGTVTQGRYAFIMYHTNTDDPTVAGIDAIVFPYCDGSDAGLETDKAWGVEHQFNLPISSSVNIESTSQLVVVGEYNGPINAQGSAQIVIDMEAGFAEQYFE